MKDQIFSAVEQQTQALCEHADKIFDHPELGHYEYFAQKQVASYLEKNGFQVELGAGGVKTAVRGEYQSLEGGPVIGFCGEFDALPIGHACGHHMQTAFALGAAVAIKNVLGGQLPFRIVVYATPDEEGNIAPGKNEMIAGGCFRELDLALIAHGGTETTMDETSLALQQYSFIYHGISTHAAAQPEAGRPAWDAWQIAIHGLSYLRPHTPHGTQIHWALKGFGTAKGGDPNAATCGSVSVSTLKISQLKAVTDQVEKVLEGAAVMTETKVEYSAAGTPYLPKFRIACLTDCFYKNAEEACALRIEAPRNKPIVTDTGSLSQVVPTCGVRIAFAPKGTGAHSQEWLAVGKSEDAHRAIVTGAKVLAGMAYDFLKDKYFRVQVQDEWRAALQKVQ